MARRKTAAAQKSVKYEMLASVLVREALERTVGSGLTECDLRARLRDIALGLADPGDAVHENWQGRPDVKLALQFVSKSELKDAINVAIEDALDPTVVHLFPSADGPSWINARRLQKNVKAS